MSFWESQENTGAPPGAGRAAEAAGAYGGWLGAPFVATMLLSKPKLDKRNQSRSAPNSYLFARAVHSAIMCVSSVFLMCFLFLTETTGLSQQIKKK